MYKTKISKTKISAFIVLFTGVFMANMIGGYGFLFDVANAATQDATFSITPNTQTVSPGQEFDVEVVVNNTTSQDIITAGFELIYPKDLIDVIDSNSTAAGVQIDSSTSDFSMTDPSLNVVNTSTGEISFTAGTQGQNPINSSTVAVATIHFQAKEGISTQVVDLEIITSANTEIMVSGVGGQPESILKVGGEDTSSVVISNISLSLSPSSQNLDINTDFTVDVVLDNPNNIEIVTLAFEMSFDTPKLDSLNSPDQLNITVDSSKNLQIIENEIKTDGTIVFTGGFTGTPMTDASLTIGTLSFKTLAEGVANVRFNPDVIASSAFILNDAANNFLGSMESGIYVIGDNVDTDAPSSEADPDGGAFSEPIRVKLSSDDSRATIYYTTDGSDPTDRDDEYDSRIDIDEDTTLKFFAVDEAGNEERVNRETYRFSDGDGGAYAIGITAVKTTLLAGEQTNMIAKLIDSSIKQPVTNKLITISNTGSGLIQAVGGYMTDDEGEVLFQYDAGQSTEIDVVTVSLAEDTGVKASLNLNIGKADISRIALFGSALDTSKTNYISATVTDTAFKRLTAQTPVELIMTKKGTSDSKSYSSSTSDGVATFSVPGGDLLDATVYELQANANGVFSNALELSTGGTGSGGEDPSTGGGAGSGYRPGGGSVPATGPAENLLAIFMLSVVGVVLYQSRQKI